MSPSTPRAAKRVISAGSFTVHACTFIPAECVSRTSLSVTNARFGCSAQSAVRRDSWISPASGGDDANRYARRTEGAASRTASSAVHQKDET